MRQRICEPAVSRRRSNLVTGDNRNYHPQHNNIITRSDLPIYINNIIVIHLYTHVSVTLVCTLYTL